MKTLIALILFVVVPSVTMAQEYKAIQFYMGLGYSWGQAGQDAMAACELSYRLNDTYALGVRAEAARQVTDKEFNNDHRRSHSYTVYGKYYLGNSWVRPYIGVGSGIYIQHLDRFQINQTEVGVYPRVGIDLGHFNLNIDYNFITASNYSYYPPFKNSYLGVRVGGFLFGGRKE